MKRTTLIPTLVCLVAVALAITTAPTAAAAPAASSATPARSPSLPPPAGAPPVAAVPAAPVVPVAAPPTVSPAGKVLQPLAPVWADSCTISCQSDPTVSCTSATGRCRYYWGGYDYIICDGIRTQCPI